MPAQARSVRARDVVVDVIVFVFVCLASFVPASRDSAGEAGRYGLIVLPFMAAAGVVLLARRRFPVPALVACLLTGLAAALLGVPHSPVFALPVAIGMYTVARYRSRALTVALAVALIVLLPLEELIIAGAGFGAGDVTAPATLQPAVLIAFAAALGSAIRSYFDALESARERARRAEESREAEAKRRVAEDRLAIARDLHDSVAHRIAVINLQAGVAERSLRVDPDEAQAAIAIVGDAARSVLAELSDMLGLLRSSADRDIVEEPDFARIQGLLSLFAKSGLKVSVHVNGEPYALDARLSPIAYRVVQEALTNAYKHGPERTAEVELDYGPDALRIRVGNPVAGEATGPSGDGHGLIGMRERLAEVGGSVQLERGDGRFELVATLPAAREEADQPGAVDSHNAADPAAALTRASDRSRS